MCAHTCTNWGHSVNAILVAFSHLLLEISLSSNNLLKNDLMPQFNMSFYVFTILMPHCWTVNIFIVF